MRELIEACLGRRKLDLLIKNAVIVNVFTEELIEGSIGIYGDKVSIVSLKSEVDVNSRRIIDCQGKLYASPGLIDIHLHIESSMVTPPRFVEAIIPRGVTTVVADPHEIVNVLGLKGLELMIESSLNLPIKVYYLVPTCVPSAPQLETSGGEITEKEVEEAINYPNVLGLAEVMDYRGVLGLRERVIRILEVGLKRQVVIEGHAPLIRGEKLNAYMCAGINSDHELIDYSEALEKVRLGMFIEVRKESLSKELIEFLDQRNPVNYSFVTDDVMADELVSEGHLDDVLRKAVELGLDPIKAIQAATIKPAMRMNLKHVGHISPGSTADIVLLSDLSKVRVETVISNGRVIYHGGKMLIDIEEPKFPSEAKRTVKLRRVCEEDFKIKAPIESGEVWARIIEVQGFETRISRRKVLVRNGFVEVSGDLAVIAVFERHGKGGGVGRGLIRVKDLSGAVASTYAHDSHNLLVLGRSPEEMSLAANELIKSNGGIIVVKDREIKAFLKLPIAGIMSEESVEKVSSEVSKVKSALNLIGFKMRNPILFISLLSLPVIPHVRVTDRGLVDVDRGELIDLFE